MTKIINCISSPRTISTALMYSFAQRQDTKVVDEPFYGYYLTKCKIEHPNHQEIVAVMETDPEKIINTVFNDQHQPILFIKNMAHHLIDMDLSFIKRMVNLFLIRDPQKLIASFTRVIPNPTETDIGVKKQFDLFKMLDKHNRVVLDSNELLTDPQKVLNHLCEKLAIPFDSNMLSWPSGPIKEDGIWAKNWYRNVHASTGFGKPSAINIKLPQRLQGLHQSSQNYYNQLYQYSIKA